MLFGARISARNVSLPGKAFWATMELASSRRDTVPSETADAHSASC